MKKILLATTMLAATAGFAAAEVTLSGDARMGVINNHVTARDGNDDTAFTSRARVTFNLSGESDSGLSFGASFRADNASSASSGAAGSVFVSASGFTVSMGDVDGAAAAAVGQVAGVGMTGLGDHNELIYVANGGLGEIFNDNDAPLAARKGLTGDPSVLVQYTSGGMSLYGSVTNPGHSVKNGEVAIAEGDAYALGAAYTMDAYTFSLGYEDLSVTEIAGPGSLDITHVVLGTNATFGQISVSGRYAKGDVDANGVALADIAQSALSATYTMDAVSVTAFVSSKSIEDTAGANILSVDAMGVGASYDLGGGASFIGGISKLEVQAGAAAAEDDTAFDLGMSFSF
jgi:outer membrane protein OmpU